MEREHIQGRIQSEDQSSTIVANVEQLIAKNAYTRIKANTQKKWSEQEKTTCSVQKIVI